MDLTFTYHALSLNSSRQGAKDLEKLVNLVRLVSDLQGKAMH